METERRHLQNAPLSPPLAKASAGVNALAEAFLIRVHGAHLFDYFLQKWGLFLNDLHWFGKHGENDKEGAPLAHGRLDPHAPLMSFNDGLDDRQPQP